MKIWEILKRDNLGKKYKTKIFTMEEIVKVDYDVNTYEWFTLKSVNNGVEYPLSQLYLNVILQMEFEEVE